MSCMYCGWRENRHDANCPKVNDPKGMERWEQGYNDGRKGKQPVSAGDTHYMMGWNQGNVALEVAENDSRRSWDD